MKDSTIIFLGVISAVIAAIVVEWLNRVFNGSTRTANDAAWCTVLSGSAGCATACSLPNLNLRPESPAYSYQTGAPVTNYRPVSRIGVLEVPIE